MRKYFHIYYYLFIFISLNLFESLEFCELCNLLLNLIKYIFNKYPYIYNNLINTLLLPPLLKIYITRIKHANCGECKYSSKIKLIPLEIFIQLLRLRNSNPSHFNHKIIRLTLHVN